MPKILLIRPENITFRYPTEYPPLNLLHLGTVLNEEGYKVKIIDVTWEKDHMGMISRELNDTLLVGITSVTSEVKNAVEISEKIKKLSDVPIVWGGWHPTLFPIQTCEDKLVDFVVVGEGEYTLLELVKALESNAPFKGIRGLVYKGNGEIKVNPPREYLDMDKLPPIEYDLIDIERYLLVRGIKKIRPLKYQSSRGCPHRCAFCINKVTGNQRYRMKSATKVADELEYLVHKYNVTNVGFIDDNFFVNIKRARAICTEIIDRNLNIEWFAECRADYFRPKFVDDDFMRLAKKSGWGSCTIGAESGSPRMLKMMQKDITVEDIINSAKMVNKYGILAAYSFIIGLPGEKKEDIFMTIKLANEIMRLCPNLVGGFVTFRPYPGSELCSKIIAEGLFKEPTTLREWFSGDYIRIYTERSYGQPWQKDPKFLQRVVHYMSRSFYPETEMKKIFRTFQLRMFPEVFFALLAKIRSQHLFFDFPVDKWIYEHFYIKLIDFLRLHRLSEIST